MGGGEGIIGGFIGGGFRYWGVFFYWGARDVTQRADVTALTSLPPRLPPPLGKRPKKGLATAKQRLGRILKIHRNGKLLL